MPPKKRIYEIVTPDWIEEITDTCLYEVVMEALVARHSAMTSGAEEHAPCASALRSADVTMDGVRFGRLKGKEACKKAAVAVRKYTTASECAHPSATRYSRKKKRRRAKG